MIIQKAMSYARAKHKGQTYNGGHYIKHPVLTYRIIKYILPIDYELQAAALLHDTLEGTSATAEELKREFGVNITKLVKEVTKTGYNTFPNLKTRRGVILKYADRLANLVGMEHQDEQWQEKYIEKSRFWET